MGNKIRIKAGDLIQYSSDPEYLGGDRVWETGFVIGPKPDREHMFIVFWYSDNKTTLEHENTEGNDYRIMPR